MTARLTWTFICTLALLTLTCGMNTAEPTAGEVREPRRAVLLEQPTPWADSLMDELTLEQQVGQLFMVPAYSNKGPEHEASIRHQIETYAVGGMIFMQGSPARQVELIRDYQELSEVPLLIAMDAEWGPAMRLDSTVNYPRQMTLGAANSVELAYDFGREVARQLKLLGVHVNFAPVVDVNNNPENPVINNRSFGENRERVSQLGAAYTAGMQDAGILACAKHFPGHGDTDVDSHKDLPVISHGVDRLDSLEMYPFRKLVPEGLGSVMIAHLHVPALDSSARKPSTLSNRIVDGWLRDSLNFEGLIFTDAMTMQGLAKYFEPGEMHVRALEAGNDVLLFPGDLKVAKARILQAIADSVLSEVQIADRCHRILKTKEWCGLHKSRFPEPTDLTEQLNRPAAKALEHRVAGAALTVLTNRDNWLPLGPDTLKVATLTIGGNAANRFTEIIDRHFSAKHFSMGRNPDFSTQRRMSESLQAFDAVLAVFDHTSNRSSKNYNITQDPIRMLRGLGGQTRVMLGVTANPYALRNLKDWEGLDAVVVGYQDGAATFEELAELVVGARGTSGRLPVSIQPDFPEGSGLDIASNGRMSVVYPSDIGVPNAFLAEIDAIIQNGIDTGAFPGCRVLLAKDGQVFYDRAFGHHTYQRRKPVAWETVYDLASITKIAASTTALMALTDEEQVHVDFNLCDYLEIPDSNAHFNMKLRDMLSHTARLKPWIPFYSKTLTAGAPDPSIYRPFPSEGFRTEVAKGVYIMDSYADSIRSAILSNGLRDERDYRYSDLGYYLIQDIIEFRSGTTLDAFMTDRFYRPLGLHSMRYNPRNHFPLENIAPTERDDYFRRQLIHGYVHDPGAAMLGGVAGHAGLFSNAWDLATLMHLFMYGGTYAGKRYLQAATVQEFTACQYCDEDNRRGIGFDKPTLSLNAGPTCNQASASSFGHSGFTGTLAWADPEHGLVYIFLSNRVYPDAANKKLIHLDIRTRIQEAAYAALNIPNRPVRRPSR